MSWFPPAITAVGGSGRSSRSRIAAAPCSTENEPSSRVYVGGRPRCRERLLEPRAPLECRPDAAAADQGYPPVAEVEQMERCRLHAGCDDRRGPG